ncbi:hypothetical protein EDD21DRAFT_364212 [Dissophora ornata]|nr:hypothetical protein BGZ58_002268 [Dissophora ornata]KAI8605208.1 hypothetical protein EDD21DRAFT_364212 [Dissophora ornata]
MASTLSRMPAQQDLTLHRRNNSPSNFPTLFHLAIQSCISHLQIFASLDGLPFHPFGQALFQEFVYRSTQWRLTTEQRQVGAILFAETYGEDDNAALGPEYTGLRCSLAQDISYLGSFAECLVYLDLSGGAGANGSLVGFTDKDMAGLSGLSRLRVLSLQGLTVGDTGVSHLIRSVTFGSSGPVGLEYLDLSGTNVTDVGLARLFGQAPGQKEGGKRLPVFKRLLGIDLTDSKVHQEVALTLFKKICPSTSSSCGWRPLEDQMILFPTLTTKEQNAAKGKDKDSKEYYLEIGSDKNPIQKWVDRLNRTYRLSFGRRPDLAGDDGLGISECLALAKLSQIYLHPLSDPVPAHQQEYARRREKYQADALVKQVKMMEDKRYIKKVEDTIRAVLNGEIRVSRQQQQSQTELEHMYNLTMYEKVLSSVRSTFGTHPVPKSPNKTSAVTVTEKHNRLAFVRNRAEVEGLLDRLELEEIVPKQSHQHEQVVSVAKDTTGVMKAKIRDRYHRPTVASSALKPLPSLSPSTHISQKPFSDQYFTRPEPSPSFGSKNPFAKRPKAVATSRIFIKQEPPTQVLDGHLPGRRRTHGGANTLQPFVKPAAEQTLNSIFITPVPPKEGNQQPQAKTTPAPSINSKPKSSSTKTMMDRWVTKALPTDASTTPSDLSHLAGKRHQGSDNTTSGQTSRESNVVREFYYTNENNDTINLDRWIRSGQIARNGKTSINDSEGPPRKVIRFDSRSGPFADKDDAEYDENVNP